MDDTCVINKLNFKCRGSELALGPFPPRRLCVCVCVPLIAFQTDVNIPHATSFTFYYSISRLNCCLSVQDPYRFSSRSTNVMSWQYNPYLAPVAASQPTQLEPPLGQSSQPTYTAQPIPHQYPVIPHQFTFHQQSMNRCAFTQPSPIISTFPYLAPYSSEPLQIRQPPSFARQLELQRHHPQQHQHSHQPHHIRIHPPSVHSAPTPIPAATPTPTSASTPILPQDQLVNNQPVVMPPQQDHLMLARTRRRAASKARSTISSIASNLVSPPLSVLSVNSTHPVASASTVPQEPLSPEYMPKATKSTRTTAPPPHTRTGSKVSDDPNALPFPLRNARETLLPAPPGARLEVNDLLILHPPSLGPHAIPSAPQNQYNHAPALGGYQSMYEMYTCRACHKTFDGKNARSVVRRHLQDKHGFPLSMQKRRTRWDGGEKSTSRS